MASATLTKQEPVPSPRPELIEKDPLTELQWQVMLAIADTIIPSIQPYETAKVEQQLAVPSSEYNAAVSLLSGASGTRDKSLIQSYLNDRPTATIEFRRQLHRMFVRSMPLDAFNQISTILNILSYRAGSLFLTGYTTPIHDQPLHIRQDIITGWATSRIPPLRLIQRVFILLAKQAWLLTTPYLNPMLGFPRTPIHGTPGKGFEYTFLQIPPGQGPEDIETDVVIIGSGCGGGVSAKNLAESGQRVIVTEMQYYWPPEHLPMKEAEGWSHLFMNGGAMLSDDSSIGVVTGSTWGGGGTINWSASLQTQGFVREEWASEGLPFFTSAAYQDALDRVCDRMGVSTEKVRHNRANQIHLEGARRLGWAHKAVPQNSGGAEHYCGYCTFGCSSCEKQGPVVSYLPDAARAGAQFVEGFTVDKVLFEKRNGVQTAVGVKGTWRSRDINGGVAGPSTTTRELIIRAKRVILAAGTMQSPLVLLRSGLKNWNIGRHLHLHPTAMVGAVFDEEIRPWEGGILTSVVSEFENLDGKGHGVKVEATVMTPTAFLPWVQWKNGLDFKTAIAKMNHTTGYVCIARDKDWGQVYPDPVDGRVRIIYHPSAVDKKSILEGLIAAAKIQYISGAKEIFTTIPHVRTFIRKNLTDDQGINDPEFQDWITEVRNNGFPSPESFFVTAHQMGTCRMATSPKHGVVDPEGKVWGTEGLYVTDASVFPSASGVNPMLTNMAISDWISRGIARDMNGKELVEKATAAPAVNGTFAGLQAKL